MFNKPLIVCPNTFVHEVYFCVCIVSFAKSQTEDPKNTSSRWQSMTKHVLKLPPIQPNKHLDVFGFLHDFVSNFTLSVTFMTGNGRSITTQVHIKRSYHSLYLQFI